MTKIIVDSYKGENPRRIFELYCQAFRAILPDDRYDEEITALKKAINLRYLSIATEGSDIIGFGSFLPLIEIDGVKEDLENNLKCAARPDLKDTLLRIHTDLAEKLGAGTPCVEFYTSDFIGRELKDNDIYLNGTVMTADYRRKGIGSKLVSKKVSMAKELGTNALFVDCWESTGIHFKYRELGFQEIIRQGPVFPDGSNTVLMGLIT